MTDARPAGATTSTRRPDTVLYRRKFQLSTAESPDIDQPILRKEAVQQRPTPVEIAQLHNEYQIAASLVGVPGVRPLLGKEGDEDRPILLLAYIHGCTLREHIKSGSIRLDQQLRLAVELATIVEAVHERRVIHKEITSSNILVSEDGTVHLIDFGKASAPGHAMPSTSRLNLENLEHLAFMSPEQTGRTSQPVDHRTDLYALGVTLYELFAGQFPFEFDSAPAMIHAHIAVQPMAPDSLDPAIPPMVSAIILKLLAKKCRGPLSNSQWSQG